MQSRTVADVMTKEVITVTEQTPFMEIVETLAEYSIKAVPVIDKVHRVIGIVSDADLFHFFLRSDDIRNEIIHEVLIRGLWQGPSRVDVRVHKGIVMWQDPARIHVRVNEGVVSLSGTFGAAQTRTGDFE